MGTKEEQEEIEGDGKMGGGDGERIPGPSRELLTRWSIGWAVEGQFV